MIRKILFCALCALALLSCKKGVEGFVQDAEIAITGDATDVTPFSVTLAARFPLLSNGGESKIDKPEVLIATDPDFEERYYFGCEDVVYNEQTQEYYYKFKHLAPGTTYYYRSSAIYYNLFSGSTVFGETRSFTTPSIGQFIVTYPPVVGSTNAVMRGALELDADILPNSLSVVFQPGRKYPKSGAIVEFDIAYSTLQEDGSFFAEYGDAVDERFIAFYKPGVKYEEEYYWGEEATFSGVQFVPSEGNIIDMGVSVKWASCNVGATKPEESGDYFAWGETASKEMYTSENYSFQSESVTTLPLENDAAHVKMGGSWRMPTCSELVELRDASFEEKGVYNNVFGYMFTSRINGNRIFFPAAGVVDGNECRWKEGGLFIWTSSHSEEPGRAYYFNKANPYATSWIDTTPDMYRGCSVRGVCQE